MTANKLVETIRSIVQSEMAKTLKPLLKEALKPLVKEMVEGQVNAVLAEKFIQTIGSQQTVVREGSQLSLTKPSVPPAQTQVQRKQIEENKRADLLKKLGVDSDPIGQLIYGDIDINQPMVSHSAPGAHATLLKNGQIYDPEADDDGVDISSLGF